MAGTFILSFPDPPDVWLHWQVRPRYTSAHPTGPRGTGTPTMLGFASRLIQPQPPLLETAHQNQLLPGGTATGWVTRRHQRGDLSRANAGARSSTIVLPITLSVPVLILPSISTVGTST